MDERKKIYADDEVLAKIKDKSRMAYVKSWKDFKTSISILNSRKATLKRRLLLSILNI